ncbi:similar to Saccharomyces cerevisiae YIR027C DAL1 Allantoinase, converts allantoin to allantoate in the first step of allantoin degradation [Maudiozyma barnettii]|uniref:allantoinase n=1 Tax=Maudiozyma barnettii TaxID=61262 RepID=A0A8H2ZH06_9SACH|nr:allantoinase [Kazachstania barnettii]CAB4255204.1 similar to Saccharomyces cerevisiae YIR027C DAL1 Allantoinase, converts allantoin to allantoate in the first step of allantoin degradation [Kazachstania barnettii]CAD1783497.1 similar to Saccharomyces cerevisiae YIR027C DAL1 Allantoinase, converts allantoin to allantoate in the first step of allantoin degradation [Kazachstania barnettii]
MSIRAITSTKVVVDQEIIPATILYSTETGKIVEIYKYDTISCLSHPKLVVYDVLDCLDVSPYVLLPGLVDSHVHLNDPGRTEWEGFETGTKSAISGGVTTVIDMPLNATPPTTNLRNLNSKITASKGNIWCDVGLWGGLVPENLQDLVPMVKVGVRGFKGFLCHSGIDEYQSIDEDYIRKAIELLKPFHTKILFHSELIHNDHSGVPSFDDKCKYDTFLRSRPDEFETNGIKLIIDCLTEITDAHPKFGAHIVHLASDKPLPLLVEVQKEYLPLTVETCFHYLALSPEDIPDSCTQYKCCPPIRSNENRLSLWRALREGLITSVVSDHSPCVPELKNLESGDFLNAWGGISSVGLNLPLLWTSGSQIEEPITITEVVKWCCENTAKHAGIDHIKGYINVGHDADFVVFDPDQSYTYEDGKSHFKNKLTPYNKMKLKGKVRSTILRGRTVFSDGLFNCDIAPGRLILDV